MMYKDRIFMTATLCSQTYWKEIEVHYKSLYTEETFSNNYGQYWPLFRYFREHITLSYLFF